MSLLKHSFCRPKKEITVYSRLCRAKTNCLNNALLPNKIKMDCIIKLSLALSGFEPISLFNYLWAMQCSKIMFDFTQNKKKILGQTPCSAQGLLFLLSNLKIMMSFTQNC